MAKRRLLAILSWAVALLLLFLLFHWLGFAEVFEALRYASPGYLLLGIALFLLPNLVRLLKWYLVLRGEYGLGDICIILFSSKAVGGLSPARLGELAPLALGKYRTGRVTALIIVDRFLEVYTTLFFGAAGFLLLEFADTGLIAVGLGIFLLTTLALVLLASVNIWRGLQSRFTHRGWLSPGLGIAVAVSEGFNAFRGLVWLMMLITFGVTLLGLIGSQVLFLAVGAFLGLPLLAAMHGLGSIASFLALTPGGLGVMEVTVTYLGTLYQVPAAQLGAFFVLSRTISIGGQWLLLVVALEFARRRRPAGLKESGVVEDA